MKNLLLFLSLFLLTTRAFSQTDKADAEAAVVQFFDGLAMLDEAKMRTHITSDFILLEDGEVWTIDTLVAELAPLKKQAFNRVNQFRFIKTEIHGNLAYTWYHNTAHVTIGERKGTMNWLESAVLRKENGRWKIALLHSTVKKK